MKRKKLLAVLLTIAMLASLSVPAFATEEDEEEEGGEGQSAVTYSYSNTSDPFTITNFSNVDVNVKVEVQFSGMTGVTFADNADCKDGTEDDAEVIPDSLYLALLVEKTEAVAAAADDADDEEEGDDEAEAEAAAPATEVVNTSGYAVAEEVVTKAAEGAYKWKVKDKADPTEGKEYVYELRDDLLEDENVASSTEFSSISVKMTGALSTEGWESFSGEPSYTITWTCSSTAEADNSRVAYNWDDDEDENTDPTPVFWDKVDMTFYDAEEDGDEVAGLTAPDQENDEIGANGLPTDEYLETNHLTAIASAPTSAGPRVAYNWDDDEDETTDPTPVFWDKVDKTFYDAEEDGDEVAGLTAPDQENDEIGANGLPTDEYLETNHLTKVASADSTATVYASGFSTNTVTFEGSAPPEKIDFDIPTTANNAFEFILDPNGLIEATDAAIYGGAEFDFSQGNGLFFKNVVTDGSGNGGGGNGNANYTGPTATIAEEDGGKGLNEFVPIQIDFGQTEYNVVTRIDFTNASGAAAGYAVTASAANYKWDADAKTVTIKLISAINGGSDWKLTLSDGTNTVQLPVNLKEAGVYKVPAEDAGD